MIDPIDSQVKSHKRTDVNYPIIFSVLISLSFILPQQALAEESNARKTMNTFKGWFKKNAELPSNPFKLKDPKDKSHYVRQINRGVNKIKQDVKKVKSPISKIKLPSWKPFASLKPKMKPSSENASVRQAKSKSFKDLFKSTKKIKPYRSNWFVNQAEESPLGNKSEFIKEMRNDLRNSLKNKNTKSTINQEPFKPLYLRKIFQKPKSMLTPKNVPAGKSPAKQWNRNWFKDIFNKSPLKKKNNHSFWLNEELSGDKHWVSLLNREHDLHPILPRKSSVNFFSRPQNDPDATALAKLIEDIQREKDKLPILDFKENSHRYQQTGTEEVPYYAKWSSSRAKDKSKIRINKPLHFNWPKFSRTPEPTALPRSRQVTYSRAQNKASKQPAHKIQHVDSESKRMTMSKPTHQRFRFLDNTHRKKEIVRRSQTPVSRTLNKPTWLKHPFRDRSTSSATFTPPRVGNWFTSTFGWFNHKKSHYPKMKKKVDAPAKFFKFRPFAPRKRAPDFNSSDLYIGYWQRKYQNKGMPIRRAPTYIATHTPVKTQPQPRIVRKTAPKKTPPIQSTPTPVAKKPTKEDKKLFSNLFNVSSSKGEPKAQIPTTQQKASPQPQTDDHYTHRDGKISYHRKNGRIQSTGFWRNFTRSFEKDLNHPQLYSHPRRQHKPWRGFSRLFGQPKSTMAETQRKHASTRQTMAGIKKLFYPGKNSLFKLPATTKTKSKPSTKHPRVAQQWNLKKLWDKSKERPVTKHVTQTSAPKAVKTTSPKAMPRTTKHVFKKWQAPFFAKARLPRPKRELKKFKRPTFRSWSVLKAWKKSEKEPEKIRMAKASSDTLVKLLDDRAKEKGKKAKAKMSKEELQMIENHKLVSDITGAEIDTKPVSLKDMKKKDDNIIESSRYWNSFLRPVPVVAKKDGKKEKASKDLKELDAREFTAKLLGTPSAKTKIKSAVDSNKHFVSTPPLQDTNIIYLTAKNESLMSVIAKVTQQSSVQVNWIQRKYQNEPISVRLVGATLEEALDWILGTYELKYRLTGTMLTI